MTQTPLPLILRAAKLVGGKRPNISKLARLLGVTFDDARVHSSLEGLEMHVEATQEGLRVVLPPHRFDIAIEADLIEEVARIIGYQAIPEADAQVPQRFRSLPSARPLERELLQTLALRGYHEAITYAFVDPQLQARLFPDVAGIALANPIASDLSVMRVSLWPGLLKAALENQRRQQDRIRLFDHGARFLPAEAATQASAATREVDSLAGIACGHRLP